MKGKRVVLGLVASCLLFAVLFGGIAAMDWSEHTDYDQAQEMPTVFNKEGENGIYDDDGNLKENTLGYSVFEKYGIVLLPLAVLMFGAMVGGVVISREEVEIDDSN